MKKTIITIITIGLFILATGIFIGTQPNKIKKIEETSTSQTIDITTSQTNEENNKNLKESPFCTEKKVEECNKNNNSECCPFELD